MDRARILEILEGYGVGKRVRRLLQAYWIKSTMVARAGGYYGTGFKGEGRDTGRPTVTHHLQCGGGSVVRQWAILAVEEAETQGERGREGRY